MSRTARANSVASRLRPMPKVHEIQCLDGSTDDGGARSCAATAAKRSPQPCWRVRPPNHDRSPECYWLRCPGCVMGSVEGAVGTVWPPADAMPRVEGLPDDVATAYDEARICFAVGAYAACEQTCRKILMHAAAAEGATAGARFVDYVDHLLTTGYVTPAMRPWVDLIRQHGNAATHDLERVFRERAQGTLMFTVELLRLVYEMAAMA